MLHSRAPTHTTVQLPVHLTLQVPTLVQAADESSPSSTEQSIELMQRNALFAPVSTVQESAELHRALQLSPQRPSQFVLALQLKSQSSAQVARHSSAMLRQVGTHPTTPIQSSSQVSTSRHSQPPASHVLDEESPPHPDQAHWLDNTSAAPAIQAFACMTSGYQPSHVESMQGNAARATSNHQAS